MTRTPQPGDLTLDIYGPKTDKLLLLRGICFFFQGDTAIHSLAMVSPLVPLN